MAKHIGLSRSSLAVYSAGFCVLILWWFARTSPVTPVDDGRISAALVSNPAVPDLDEEVARVLRAAEGPVANNSTSIEAPPTDPTQWKSLPVERNDIVYLAVAEPGSMSLDKLLRHPNLNSRDIEVPEAEWKRELRRLEPSLEKIQQLSSIEAKTADAEMKSAVASGTAPGEPLKQEAKGDLVEFSFAPSQARRANIYGTHSSNGIGYVFQLKDLPQTFTTVQTREVMVFDYLNNLLAFFVRHGTLSPGETATMLERYQAASRTLK